MSHEKPNATRKLEVLLKLPGNAPVTAKEAALLLRRSEDALAHDRSRGGGVRYFKIGRLIRYRLDELLPQDRAEREGEQHAA